MVLRRTGRQRRSPSTSLRKLQKPAPPLHHAATPPLSKQGGADREQDTPSLSNKWRNYPLSGLLHGCVSFFVFSTQRTRFPAHLPLACHAVSQALSRRLSLALSLADESEAGPEPTAAEEQGVKREGGRFPTWHDPRPKSQTERPVPFEAKPSVHVDLAVRPPQSTGRDRHPQRQRRGKQAKGVFVARSKIRGRSRGGGRRRKPVKVFRARVWLPPFG